MTRHDVPSLRWRLLAVTLAAGTAAVALTGLLLSGLFRDHLLKQFASTLTVSLDALTGRLDIDDQRRPSLDAAVLPDPRWARPYGGLYWQLDAVRDGVLARGELRSRSLWDTRLPTPDDAVADGTIHQHRLAGPGGARLLALERTVRLETAPAPASRDSPLQAPSIPLSEPTTTTWRLVVAGDLGEVEAATARFDAVLALSLAALALLLGLAAWAQVRIGLAPLNALAAALMGVRSGMRERLEGRFPAEVQPLVDDFNTELDRRAEVVARARHQAGNLAHALKTPLAALANAAQAAQAEHRAPSAEASDPPARALAQVVDEQVQLAQRHIDWHLARARAAAAHGLPGTRTPVRPVLDSLLRVMARIHADKALQWTLQMPDPPDGTPDFAGEAEDLHEMLGNLLDNAHQWATSQVHVHVGVQSQGSVPVPVPVGAPWDGHPTAGSADLPDGHHRAQDPPQPRGAPHGADHPGRSPHAGSSRLTITIDDDGPGIAADQRAAALARGGRLDERRPGSGLGLAIVHDIASLYGGTLVLDEAPLGGSRAVLTLPAAPAALMAPVTPAARQAAAAS